MAKKQLLFKCKFCPYSAIHWKCVKEHVMDHHPEEYNQIQAWLGESMPSKTLIADRIAKQGMKGPFK